VASLTKLRFDHDGRRYELDLNWDDAAFADGELKFDVTARAGNKDLGLFDQEHSVSVIVTLADARPVFTVQADGHEVFTLPLDNLVDEAEVLERIPSHLFGGDPMIGCLIRSGVSAFVGQLIHCKNNTSGDGWRERLRAIGACLRANIPGMTGRAAFRAARCMLRAGF
jgi:hypothetical protein